MQTHARRPLYFDPRDGRPDSAFVIDWLNTPAIVGGLISSLLIPLAFVMMMVIIALSAALVSSIVDSLDGEEELEPVLEEEDVIEAHFVQLGRDFQDELPNRIVPILSTAPPEPSQVPTEQTPQAEQVEQPEVRPPDAVDDALTRLGDRAHVFAELAERREREGSPDGIEEGTQQEGTEGDIYRGRLYAFFRRGWTIPTTMARDEAQGLTAVIDVQIGPDLQIVSFEIRTSSGSPLFDESIIQQLSRLQAADQHIPPPPEDVANQYIGQRIAVRFHGRQAG